MASSAQGWKETPLGRAIKVLLIKGAGFNSIPDPCPLPFPPKHIQASLAAGAEPVLSQRARDVTQGNRR